MERVIVIGASGDGIEAIATILRGLPASFAAPVLVAQHVGRTSAGHLPAILRRAGRLPAIHPHDGQAVVPGVVYVAPPDHHMLVSDGIIRLNRGPEVNHARPAVDVLFRSAAETYGAAVVGIVLTGHLNDGTAGLAAIKARGGIAIIQDPDEAGAPSMPRSALENVAIDHVCGIAEIAPLLVKLVADPPLARDADPPPAAAERVAGRG